MSKIWSMMDVGRRSLMNSQTGLQTVAHNIANKSTDGYSRQRVEFQSNVPIGEGRYQIGMGSRPGTITRINDAYLEKQIEKEVAAQGNLDAKAEGLARVEQVYNEQINKGLNKYMGEFFNAWRELSNNPESLATRTLVKEAGDFLAKDFQRVTNSLSEIQNDLDYQISSQVLEINEMTKEIAQLNEKISSVELTGARANDQRDRRDELIKRLGEKINIHYGESKDGQVTITAGNSALLVSGFSYRELTTGSTPARPGKLEGRLDVFYRPNENSNDVNVTKQLTGGSLGGLIYVRDNRINELLDRMDEMAYTIAEEVNQAHVLGYDRYNRKGTEFFKVPEDGFGAASTLKVSDTILRDPGAIAVAAQPFAPGDNRVANVISSLQYKPVLQGGTVTLDDFYSSVIGQVGVEAMRANSAIDSQKDIVKQLRNIRESISGVSLDEEATKMIEYQKSFEASARLIRTADEMMDTVLALKKL